MATGGETGTGSGSGPGGTGGESTEPSDDELVLTEEEIQSEETTETQEKIA